MSRFLPICYAVALLSRSTDFRSPRPSISPSSRAPRPVQNSPENRVSSAPFRRFHAVPGGGHNDTLFRGGTEYWLAWQDLVAALPAS